MTDSVSSYQLSFETRPRRYLHARVKAETASPDIIFGYLQEILGKCLETGFDRVLVEREIPTTLANSDALLSGSRLLEKGLGQLKIALVDAHSSNIEGLNFVVLLLNNRGATVQLFDDIPAAEAWLMSP